jgi:hypothetical protein
LQKTLVKPSVSHNHRLYQARLTPIKKSLIFHLSVHKLKLQQHFLVTRGFLLPFCRRFRQPPATFSQSSDTKWQIKAGTPLALYPAFASAALISFNLLVFIHYRS